ncbi:hypothetical protein QCE47_18580 [Caballeronia sp. LZ025]|uniref:hypothetical protein n=1 Tax=Caballeronia TaxID=1827195 RepID=UPI001FCFDA77|nr:MULTISPECIES: hypothetical protein [Caballeronia]MDR5734314.1 hypothetical protein [Caballeronia sp. LZ025]
MMDRLRIPHCSRPFRTIVSISFSLSHLMRPAISFATGSEPDIFISRERDAVKWPARSRDGSTTGSSVHVEASATNEVTLIGIDLGKHVFHLHAQHAKGHDVFHKRLARLQLILFFSNPNPIAIVKEASAGSH